MKRILNMSFKLKFLLLFTLIFVVGFTVFLILGFKADKWFTGWVIFGCITIIPNIYYFANKAKIDNKKHHYVRRYSGKIDTEKPRVIQSLVLVGISICFGPFILLGAIIGTLLGGTI